ncbi:hypothetical protein ABWH89_00350 [Hoeflea alexandrii]|uniref:Uncharacterized protein n=1 Tax=Hoeflea alexandrii TaxID=288436 RepID=A0ABT1CT90_9HYPH|nr:MULTISPECIES: hypothetical protein [Hoeflea]MCO6409412.1 hypothetical protein [Hoeflea alexandrii]MCY0152005.1 hypothetical protein [Hoeflea alexandrii]
MVFIVGLGRHFSVFRKARSRCDIIPYATSSRPDFSFVRERKVTLVNGLFTTFRRMCGRRAVSPDSLYLVFAGLKSGFSASAMFAGWPKSEMDVLRTGVERQAPVNNAKRKQK